MHLQEAPSIAISPEISKGVGTDFSWGMRFLDRNFLGLGQRLSLTVRDDSSHQNPGFRCGVNSFISFWDVKCKWCAV